MSRQQAEELRASSAGGERAVQRGDVHSAEAAGGGFSNDEESEQPSEEACTHLSRHAKEHHQAPEKSEQQVGVHYDLEADERVLEKGGNTRRRALAYADREHITSRRRGDTRHLFAVVDEVKQ